MSFSLTWSTGFVDLSQQSQTLLLGPVVNDSSQNEQIGRGEVIGEEISCDKTHAARLKTQPGDVCECLKTSVWPTALEADGVVLPSEVFLSHFSHGRQVEHCHRRRGVLSGQLPSQSPRASWEIYGRIQHSVLMRATHRIMEKNVENVRKGKKTSQI